MAFQLTSGSLEQLVQTTTIGPLPLNAPHTLQVLLIMNVLEPSNGDPNTYYMDSSQNRTIALVVSDGARANRVVLDPACYALVDSGSIRRNSVVTTCGAAVLRHPTQCV